ncbi:MAG: exopolysaccharide biosynthesis polyprenyl glycosylphosphotransferase [Myxococcaceae bacterium]
MLRAFHHYFSARKLTFFVVESRSIALACGLGAAGVSTAVMSKGEPSALLGWLPAFAFMAVAVAAVLQFSLYALDLYDLRVAGEDRLRGTRALKAAGVALTLMALAAAAARSQVPPGALMGGAVGAFVGTIVVRWALPSVVGAPSRVLIIGSGMKALQMTKLIEAEGENALSVVGAVEPQRIGAEAAPSDSLDVIARKLNAEYVVMAIDEPRGTVWVDALLRCRLEGRKVYDAGGFCERVLRRIPVAHLRVAELAFSDDLTVSPMRRVLKRALDIAVAGTMLVFGWFPMLLIALAVKLDSKGPIFYKQERTGLSGRPFDLWKFRSMRTDAEKNGAVWARTDDDRVTRVGQFIRKTRLDELPQLFNVLRGEMSFVGPRPERPVFVEELKRQLPHYHLRDALKPGLTGWAQIRYPYGASVEDARNKLEFDLYYIKNGSLFLDLACIFHTVRHVLMRKGSR